MRSWPRDVRVAPSILSSDFGRVREQVSEVMDAGARVIHVDVMDGHFVPVITFGPKMLADVAGVIHDHDGFADVHLMIEQPERHLAQFAEAGADSITVHVETCPHLHYTLQMIHDLGCRAGVTLNPGTPVEAIAEAARYADVLLCMSVNPGCAGQTFIPATLDRLPQMRALAARATASPSRSTAASTRPRSPLPARPARTSSSSGSAIFGAPSPGGRLPRPGRPRSRSPARARPRDRRCGPRSPGSVRASSPSAAGARRRPTRWSAPWWCATAACSARAGTSAPAAPTPRWWRCGGRGRPRRDRRT